MLKIYFFHTINLDIVTVIIIKYNKKTLIIFVLFKLGIDLHIYSYTLYLLFYLCFYTTQLVLDTRTVPSIPHNH